MSGWTVTTRTYDLSTEVDSDDVTRTDHADTDTVAQREPVTSFDGPTGWAPADVPPQPCPCPPCLAARSLDLGGYDREPCAYTPEGFALERIRIGAHAAPAAPVAVLFVDPRGPYPALGVDWYDAARDARSYQGSAPAPASRRNVYAAIRASGRVVDVVAIARACRWNERHTATLAHEWARNDVGCEECAARGTRIGCGGDVYDCPDCDGSGRDLARLGRMILDGAELECGFCSADVEHGDVSCAECGVEFVEYTEAT